MNTLKAQLRNMEKKAKQIRRQGYITGNLFGKEVNPSLPIQINRMEAERALKGCLVGSQVMLDVDGKEYDVIIKEMHYDSVKRQMLEIDFQALVRGEKVHSVAEIILTNKEKVVEGVLEQLLEEVSYRALPTDLVDKIYIDAGELRLGSSIRVENLEISKNPNIDVLTHKDTMVVNVVPSKHVAEETVEETTEKEK